jgi:hypothetical protein
MSGKNPLGNGKEPQSYEGINVIVPIGGWQLIKSARAPTSNDKKYPIGSIWVNTATNAAYILTSAPGSWSLFGSSSGGAVNSITGDSGGAELPVAGNFTLAGTSNQITITGSAGTETFSLAGPYTPATYTAHGVLIGEGTSSIVATAAGTNGQVLLGSTGADPAFGTLTTSTGIAFTTGAASLAINVATGGFAVVDQTTSSATLAVQTMYMTDNGASLVTYTLPATAPLGSTIRIVGSSAGGWRIAQNANQKIRLTTQVTTTGTGGSLSSSNANDCVELIASTGGASTVWTVASFAGSLTFV